ncbi:CARDB domain-containing protein, partial [Paenibacillus sp. y28]|uniref:CARDB domain-containing protein n=1 Tax=Paenibacillus sp. y28 TaxID=3129110 RepID=UPI0030199EED
MKRKSFFKLSGAVAVLLSISLLASILIPDPPSVYAEDAEITYGISADKWQSDGGFTKYSTLPGQVTLEKTGYKIVSAEVVRTDGGSYTQKITDAIGQTSWTGQLTIPGVEVPVSSIGNETVKGYYAWYRYSKADNDPYWYADFDRIDDSYNGYGEQRKCKSPDLDSFGLPATPGCDDSRLTLSGGLEKAFLTNNGKKYVHYKFVDNAKATGVSTINYVEEILGPEGITGMSDGTTNATGVKMSPDMEKMTVEYYQNFDHINPGGDKNFAAYGAKMAVYFAAFKTDIYSFTYQYPYKVQVVYEPIQKPDLVADSIALTSKLKLGETGEIEVKFHNAGVNITKDFKVAAFASGTPLQGSPVTINGMTAGESKTLRFPFTFTTTGNVPIEFKVDYGTTMNDNGIIDEENEANNVKGDIVSPDLGIDGDFGIPTEVTLRDPIPITPKDFDVPAACGYE